MKTALTSPLYIKAQPHLFYTNKDPFSIELAKFHCCPHEMAPALPPITYHIIFFKMKMVGNGW
jgi:hypothetical protein